MNNQMNWPSEQPACMVQYALVAQNRCVNAAPEAHVSAVRPGLQALALLQWRCNSAIHARFA